MAWFRKEKKPRLPQRERLEIPPDAWEKCEACGHTDLREKFVRNLNVCPNCDFHRRIRAAEYCNILLDDGWGETETGLRSADPLGFAEYPQRLKKAQTNAGDGDAILTATGAVGGIPVNLGVMDFAFMGGSMGIAVGAAFVEGVKAAIKAKCPYILFTAAGGARMQEGILSLMQMPRSTVALAELREAGLPYIVVLTDPTTGGVTASYAMLGDVQLAEPGALIGFAGQRVIEQTIREKLPEGFQRAEYLLEHGMIDMVVPRAELRSRLATLIDYLAPAREAA